MAAMALRVGEAALPAISGAGSGTVQPSPQLVRLAEVVARINAKDQFLDSRNMRDSIIDAIFETDSAKGKLAGAAMADDARAERLIRLIGEFMWEARRERNA